MKARVNYDPGFSFLARILLQFGIPSSYTQAFILMASANNWVWLSTYLYYAEPQESFLVKGLYPFVRTLLQTGSTRRFFFIRYAEGGAHIRLRIQGEPSVLEKIIKPNLIEHFENYFETRPSLRFQPSSVEQATLHPNNTIAFVPYEPEVDRFGGTGLMDLAEAHFSLSSRISLDIMEKANGNWMYDSAIGTALRLQFLALEAWNVSNQDKKRFLGQLLYRWLPAAASSHDIEHCRPVIRQFDLAFQQQQHQIIPFVASMLEDIQANDLPEESIYASWFSENRILLQEIEQYFEFNGVPSVPSARDFQYNGIPLPESTKLALLAEFIHLTNNRLGIYNKDEGYISYLLLKSLQFLHVFA